MSWDPLSPVLQDVSDEPPTPSGSFETSSTSYRRKAGHPIGAAGSVTDCRSTGALPAKPLCEDLPKANAVPALGKPEQGGSTFKDTGSRELSALMTAREASCHVLCGDLDLAIRDLNKFRSFCWLSQTIRMQLGRCLFELNTARRMLS